MNQLLVVDDEPGMRSALEVRFRRRGWRVDTAAGVTEACARLGASRYAVVITDVRMPDGDGLKVLAEARRLSPGTPVVLLTAFASVPGAVEAMKGGACDYLVKPVSFEELESAVERMMRTAPGPVGDVAMVGRDPAWLRAIARAQQVAGCDADVLIEAESGTCKELVARLIHGLSARRDRPFVAVNCAALPDSLLESELFGHARGAFTGALNSKPGKFAIANHGTLLLDEVGEMPLALQPKLLRVLQEREVDPLGGCSTMSIDIRVIATTNRSLQRLVTEGRFREDLYYRLAVVPVGLPPLRERRQDIPALALHFAHAYCAGRREVRLTPGFLARLAQHHWPGNVRELANFMRRAVALRQGDTLDESSFPDEFPSALARAGLQAGVSLHEAERQLLEVTLRATAGNRSRAAQMLGVSLRTVRNKIREYGLPSRRSYAHD